MAKKKILLVSHEMAPFTDLSEMSEFVKGLAIQLKKNSAEVRIFLPKLGTIKERKHRLHEVIRLSGLNIIIGRDNNPMIIKVASLQSAKVQVYFLDNDDFYKRKFFMKNKTGKYYDDNDKRIIFFNKGVLELLDKLGWIPDVIHCEGWMSSLIPYYARTVFKNEPALKNIKILYSIKNNKTNQQLGEGFEKLAHIDTSKDKNLKFLTNPKISELYKVGLNYADEILVNPENETKEINEFIKKSGKKVFDTSKLKENEIFEKYTDFIIK
ncbi:MAG: glycogen/starch synthase [Bacteroidota bacterium]|nr:glycogen/starch synthase [Bacteroidota bacterium]